MRNSVWAWRKAPLWACVRVVGVEKGPPLVKKRLFSRMYLESRG